MTSPFPPCFRVQSATFAYPPSPGQAARPIFEALSLTIPAGEVTALAGPSGVGKSTLLFVLGLLWEQDRRRQSGLTDGQIVYTDRQGRAFDYATLRPADRAALRAEQFGFSLQSASLQSTLTIEDNLAMPLMLLSVPAAERSARIARLVDHADPTGTLHGLRRRYPRDLSGGQRQRIALIKAVIHDPAVVLADEPVSNLDPVSRDHILAFLRDWQSGRLMDETDPRPRTVVMVSHDEHSQHTAHHVIRLTSSSQAVVAECSAPCPEDSCASPS